MNFEDNTIKAGIRFVTRIVVIIILGLFFFMGDIILPLTAFELQEKLSLMGFRR